MDEITKKFWVWAIGLISCMGIEFSGQLITTPKIYGVGIIGAIFLSELFMFDFLVLIERWKKQKKTLK